jgi:heme oxygenase (biliverdin-IX-beta and delta-forming)
MNSSRIMEALSNDTADVHRSLEGELNLMDGGLSVSDYVDTLQTFAAFVSEWELKAAQHCPPALQRIFDARRRALLLDADLHYFHASPLSVKPAVPAVDNTARFLGAMYVMEGSTLGGQFISRHLETALGLRDGRGYSYFRGHGFETGRMWKDFTEVLMREAVTQPEKEIIEAARNMFEAFRHFIVARQSGLPAAASLSA